MDEKDKNMEGYDPFDFSWKSFSKETAMGELSGAASKMYEVIKLLNHMVYNNDYSNTAAAYLELQNSYLGAASWVNQFYNENKDDFEPCLRSESRPSWYRELASTERDKFELALKYGKDASISMTPVDQMQLIMLQLPLLSSFRLMRLTMTLIDEQFDKELYDSLNEDIQNANMMINKSWTNMENLYSRISEAYYKENHGKIPDEELNRIYRQKRVEDYIDTFRRNFPKQKYSFPADENGQFSLGLNTYVLFQSLDAYMQKVAEVMNGDLESQLEACLKRCEQQDAVIKSRMQKCQTEEFQILHTALEGLNNEIKDYCQLALTVYNSFKNGDENDPYCFAGKLPVYSSLNGKYGLSAISSDPVRSGTKFVMLYQSAVNALNMHRLEFVEYHGHPEIK